MLMFHEAAGGRNYTALRHRHQQELDFSRQLVLNRAILAGRVAEPATQWVCESRADRLNAGDENPVRTLDEHRELRHATPAETSNSFFRVLLPVNRYGRDLSS